MATAIPKITVEFNSLGDVGWYGSAYLLTSCALTLMFGKLFTFYSTKWVFLIALGIFEIGSLVCGVAPDSTTLIIGRAIAGVGGAGIFAGCFLIIAQAMPLERRPFFTSLVGSLYGIASMAGPVIGGVLTDNASWRWCFYINLPVGGLTGCFLLFLYKPPRQNVQLTLREKIGELDLIGTAFYLPAIICLLFALQWGGSRYAWNSGPIVGLFVAFGVLLSIFGTVQWWQKGRATIPPELIRTRDVWGPALYTFCLSSSFTIYTYYVSDRKQQKQYPYPPFSHAANTGCITSSSLCGFSQLKGCPPQSPVS
jgi:MFS family permease